jgi:hypothetical protein
MPRQINYGLDTVGNFRLYGFATGCYCCKCVVCGGEYTGDKLSVQCLSCSLKQAENLFYIEKHAQALVKAQEESYSCANCCPGEYCADHSEVFYGALKNMTKAIYGDKEL